MALHLINHDCLLKNDRLFCNWGGRAKGLAGGRGHRGDADARGVLFKNHRKMIDLILKTTVLC